MQADAFRLDPPAYLQALAWRVRGLKLRSRNTIAALAGHSPAAYKLWIARSEPRLLSAAAQAPAAELPKITPVIDCASGLEAVADTLASMPPGVQPILVGAPALPGTAAVDSVAELANRLGDGEAWLCPLRAGDRLGENALAAYGTAILDNPGACLAYADDDLIESGVRVNPHFKPDWNPELFEHHDFITGACIVKSTGERMQSLPANGWAQALVRQALEEGAAPRHIPLILHHRQGRPQPVVPKAPANVVVEGWPLVSVIIPTRNRADLLRKCVDGLDRASYTNVEILIIDNESDEPASIAYFDELRARGVRVRKRPGAFNYSQLNNYAVEHARGELLCFLNNDIEMIEPDWLSLLASRAVRPDIGAVGARLLYPDGTVQHAGVFTGVGGGAAHGHRFQSKDDGGYFERARLPQRVSAVTGACLVVAREKFLAVGGFDEENFPVAFNDVDLCLKLNQSGWQSFYEPRATLVHHESKSRGSDRLKENRVRFAGELAMLKRKWQTDVKRDPFHHPQLSPFCEQFLISV